MDGRKVLVLRLEMKKILNANKVRILFFQPVIKSFFCGILDAVSAETDDPHS